MSEFAHESLDPTKIKHTAIGVPPPFMDPPPYISMISVSLFIIPLNYPLLHHDYEWTRLFLLG